MDEQTALVLALQLVALFSIAGALLLYLLCKIRTNNESESNLDSTGAGKPILVTSCDNALGLQVAIHLADKGFRVFAGLRLGEESVSSKIIRAWQKRRESTPGRGSIVALPVDVTREDILHESVDLVRAHLPAGEDGIWAVILTDGLAYRGPLIQQDVTYWDAMIKTNVVGVLRTARTYHNLLKNCEGRILTLGATENFGSGLVAYAATRFAVEGACEALRQELMSSAIKVVTLRPLGVMPELLFAPPKLQTNVELSEGTEFQPTVLSERALQILDVAVTSRRPKCNYTLEYKSRRWTKPLESLKIV